MCSCGLVVPFLCDVLWFAYVLCFVVVERVLFVFDLFVLFVCGLWRDVACVVCVFVFLVCLCICVFSLIHCVILSGAFVCVCLNDYVCLKYNMFVRCVCDVVCDVVVLLLLCVFT